jgi:flagellar hook-basal body complex protein FliE
MTMIGALLPLAASAVQTLTTSPAAPATTASGASFSDIMAQASGDALKTLKTAEASSMTGLEGNANVQQVVENVMSAERTLQTTLAIRDKAVAAWQQVSQTAI